RGGCEPAPSWNSGLERACALLLSLRCSALGRRPTVGPQTLDLLIGVRIPASQLDLASCPEYRTQKRTQAGLSRLGRLMTGRKPNQVKPTNNVRITDVERAFRQVAGRMEEIRRTYGSAAAYEEEFRSKHHKESPRQRKKRS